MGDWPTLARWLLAMLALASLVAGLCWVVYRITRER